MFRLRQDGIMGTRAVTDSRFGIPFSTKRLEAYKSTLILQRFLTNVSLDLDFGDLSVVEVVSILNYINLTKNPRTPQYYHPFLSNCFYSI